MLASSGHRHLAGSRLFGGQPIALHIQCPRGPELATLCLGYHSHHPPDWIFYAGAAGWLHTASQLIDQVLSKAPVDTCKQPTQGCGNVLD